MDYGCIDCDVCWLKTEETDQLGFVFIDRQSTVPEPFRFFIGSFLDNPIEFVVSFGGQDVKRVIGECIRD